MFFGKGFDLVDVIMLNVIKLSHDDRMSLCYPSNWMINEMLGMTSSHRAAFDCTRQLPVNIFIKYQIKKATVVIFDANSWKNRGCNRRSNIHNGSAFEKSKNH